MRFLYILIILLLSVPIVLSIDSSICQSANPEEDYKACIKMQEPLKLIWEQKSDEVDKYSSNFFAADSEYNLCRYTTCAKGAINPITTTEIKTDNDESYCIQLLCEPLLKAYNKNIKILEAEEEKLKNDFDLAQCDNCVIPFCRYQIHADCTYLGKFCKELSSITDTDYIGCTETPNETPSVKTNIPQTTTQTQKTEPKTTTTNQQTKTNLQIQNENKIDEISKKNNVEVKEIETKNGKKKIILTNPDNSKANIDNKDMYYKKDEIKKTISDQIGDVPGIGPYKDYIMKFFDDQKSDEEKTTDTQINLDIGKNAANLFNQMDGTGDKELSLSIGKNLIPTSTATKPYEFIFDQLGGTVKKTMAHGYNSEYNSVLEEARLLRESGLTWSQTIKQTTALVAEANEGKRWSQTVSAFSKDEFKTFESRVNLYILQMKENGELQ